MQRPTQTRGRMKSQRKSNQSQRKSNQSQRKSNQSQRKSNPSQPYAPDQSDVCTRPVRSVKLTDYITKKPSGLLLLADDDLSQMCQDLSDEHTLKLTQCKYKAEQFQSVIGIKSHNIQKHHFTPKTNSELSHNDDVVINHQRRPNQCSGVIVTKHAARRKNERGNYTYPVYATNNPRVVVTYLPKSASSSSSSSKYI